MKYLIEILAWILAIALHLTAIVVWIGAFVVSLIKALFAED